MVGVALIAAIASSGSDSASPKKASPASTAAVVAKATSVAPSVFARVGAGSSKAGPQPIAGANLAKSSKARVLYVGAEYCPYCATERWPLVIALSRFGHFTGLGLTHSSGSDAYPNTPTFTFHGAKFTSTYLSFQSVELEGNRLEGGQYPVLERPSAEQKRLMDKYDAPPYVDESAAGTIPFILFDEKYLVSGAEYDPAVLQGKSATDIASALSDAGSDLAKGAVGVANRITATICSITDNRPSAVCASPLIRGLKAEQTAKH